VRLYEENGIYYADLRIGGRRLRRSTRCSDRRAAETVAKQWEREEADPDHATTSKATLSDALKLLLDTRDEQARAGRKSDATASFYRAKAGHWTRLLETNSAGTYAAFPLAKLDARDVDGFISKRRNEGAKDNTINKELVTLRAALKLAKRAGIWKGDIDSVLPVGFAPAYKPKKRALTYAEAQRLLANLTPDRAARVAFMIATSANWGETENALREDIAPGFGSVLIRGTKRATRFREVPIVSHDQRSLLEHAAKFSQGVDGALFRPWQNARRDLQAACKRAGIESVSPNDLRRTCATWLRAQGAPPHLIAPVMGHVDSRMVERVYGRLPTDQLAQRLSQELGENSLPNVCLRPADSADLMDARSGRRRNAKSRAKRGLLSAQRRNRTADTRIFNPRLTTGAPRQHVPVWNRSRGDLR
jgi:integrase